MELDRKPVSPTESTGEGIAVGNTLEQSVRISSRAERRTQRYVMRGLLPMRVVPRIRMIRPEI